METLRTPDDRFADLEAYAFAPHYLEIDDGDGGTLRVHHVDEGPADSAPILLLHGEPSWSYLYRHVIPPLAAAGHRVIAPDLVGFGRSDKPTQQSDYSYARLVRWLEQVVVDRLDLRDITLFCQDWGGLLGLRLVAAHPDRFARVIAANTGLPTGEHDPGEAFLAWQKFAREAERFPVGGIINGGVQRGLTPAEITAYDAPFHVDAATAGARALPSLVPTSPDDPEAAAQQRAWAALATFERPFLTAFSDEDPITKDGERPLQKLIAGAQGQPHVTTPGAGHFLQEDAPDRLVELISGFVS